MTHAMVMAQMHTAPWCRSRSQAVLMPHVRSQSWPCAWPGSQSELRSQSWVEAPHGGLWWRSRAWSWSGPLMESRMAICHKTWGSITAIRSTE